MPDSDPLDNCSVESHGTHVAGIVGGVSGIGSNVQWTGVAIEADIGMYRVFGCNGSTTTDVITAAIFMAAEAGADVINLSIGGGPAFADDSDVVAADTVSKMGHIVVASAGNDGASGLFVTGNPGNGKSVISVASFDNIDTVYSAAIIGGMRFAYTASNANGSVGDGTTVWEVVVNNPLAVRNNILDDGCSNSTTLTNATGKALLIRWSSACSSAIRCSNAFHNSNATLCIIYGNTQEIVPILGTPLIPGIFLSQSGGLKLLSQATIQLTHQVIFQNLTTSGQVSSFSSGGLSLEGGFKPDIGGIGGSVLSCLSPFAVRASGGNSQERDWGVLSGTSMAAPYISGVIALILQARKMNSGTRVGVEELKDLLSNAAKPSSWLEKLEIL
ncbi:subtilisin-like protein [Rhizoclosmatium globosum]|uniref:Subtilisin-like protein n=1 Tax=Rhizoclosmatium globosum TaxID=329046 RepID=A0A1Y2CZN5_9FUNG|nr:subtilisin-like protein [Rhizoclosmatium globosum]|eukprot:ORY52336.1 subtilisin-like protein [Rhizoclosmatium globosum]